MRKTRGYRSAIETAWVNGTFGYFGFTQRELILLNGSTGSKERREGLLQRAHKAGACLNEAT
jgi:NAD(P)H dehydrogenase (quinone)